MSIAMIAEPLSETIPNNSSLEAPQPESKPHRALLEILQTQFEALQGYHLAVMKSDDPEAIHKMRVTTRRTQAALDLLASQIDINPVKKRLRRWRQELSRVRNYDVFLILLEKEKASSNADHRQPFDLVRDELLQRRTDTIGKVRTYLMDKSVRNLAARINLQLPAAPSAAASNLANNLPPAEANNASPASEQTLTMDEGQLAAHTAASLEQRVAEFLALAAHSHATTEAAELHELRIAAKRVRYLFEIIPEMGYGDASQALTWLRTLQDRIGDWHDLESLELELVEIIAQRDYLKAHLLEGSQMLKVAAHLQKKKERLGAKIFPVQVPEILLETSQGLAAALRRFAATSQLAFFEAIPDGSNDSGNLPVPSSQEPQG